MDATISQLDPEYLAGLPSHLAEEVRQQLSATAGTAGPKPDDAFAALMNSARSPNKAQEVSVVTPIKGKKRGRPPKNSPRFIKKSTKPVIEKTPANRELFKAEQPPSGAERDAESFASLEKEEMMEEPSLEGATSLDDVRSLLKQWVRHSPSTPTEDDLSTVATYFRALVRTRRPDVADLLLRMLDRITRGSADGWRGAFDDIMNNVQEEMKEYFGYRLYFNAAR